MCAIIACSFVTFDFAGLSSNLAYITSVFIGYIGTGLIGSLIKRFAAKKWRRQKSLINVAAFDMLAVEELITDVRNRNAVVDVRKVRKTLIIWPPPQTCHAKPKTKSTGAVTTSFRSGCLPRWIPVISPKSQWTLWHCSDCWAKSADYDWSWWYPSGNRPLQYIQLYCRALVMVSSEHKGWQPDCKIREAGGNGGQRDWWASRVTAIISALVICIIVCLSWAVNH